LIPQVRQVRAAQRQEEAEQSEFEVRVDARVRINDALDPVIRLLGSLMHAPPGERDQTRARDATKHREYRTFVSVSVIAGDTAYGMRRGRCGRLLGPAGLPGSKLGATITGQRGTSWQ
jgi:hypothetical protein